MQRESGHGRGGSNTRARMNARLGAGSTRIVAGVRIVR